MDASQHTTGMTEMSNRVKFYLVMLSPADHIPVVAAVEAWCRQAHTGELRRGGY